MPRTIESAPANNTVIFERKSLPENISSKQIEDLRRDIYVYHKKLKLIEQQYGNCPNIEQQKEIDTLEAHLDGLLWQMSRLRSIHGKISCFNPKDAIKVVKSSEENGPGCIAKEQTQDENTIGYYCHGGPFKIQKETGEVSSVFGLSDQKGEFRPAVEVISEIYDKELKTKNISKLELCACHCDLMTDDDRQAIAKNCNGLEVIPTVKTPGTVFESADNEEEITIKIPFEGEEIKKREKTVLISHTTAL